MPHLTSPAIAETGYVVLDPFDPVDAAQWRSLEYIGWRSSGVTRFAPLASYDGSVDCNGFWNRTPPRTDKDGVWVDAQAALAPALVGLAREPGANVGRCRVVELQPNTYADALYNLHHDDNNRLNPDGTGWVVRGFLNLTDDPGSVLVLREDQRDPSGEVRIPLAAGCRVIVDTERYFHAVWHTGDSPRYALVTSWTSGPELDAYIAAHHGHTRVANPPLEPALLAEAQAELHRRLDERAQMFQSLG
ncbi:hypothetical protein RYJ27_01210 [Microbacterium limosum]|uniref:2OG-Fe(II) oxygenase n=1 Tax=Microbacterium limosum TaxID=3079935 RepID=A0AAU0MH17_9MICO|nr:hypothetical protein [Microbacterium sp. Y20]WOQ69890.1 hypothetical protein RYJ27_01210 [Microbacterium sp. Y20]